MRLPIQIECVVYKKNPLKFLILKRISSRGDFWQSVTGGYEEGDTSLKNVAWRELNEELNLKKDDVVKSSDIIKESQFEQEGFYYTEFSFSFEVKESFEPTLSEEHSEFKWLSKDEALQHLKFDSNKEAIKKACEKVN